MAVDVSDTKDLPVRIEKYTPPGWKRWVLSFAKYCRVCEETVISATGEGLSTGVLAVDNRPHKCTKEREREDA